MNSSMHGHNGQAVWSLEALRGLAAWMVIYAHYAPFADLDIPLLRFMFTGVDLFFVLSGYLFAPYLFGRKLVPAEFAIRRIFRIYPAYLLSLLVYAGLKIFSGLPLLYFVEHLLFAHLQFREMTLFYNPAYWSLPAEVEFYLFLPLMAKLVSGKPLRFAIIFGVALIIRIILGYLGDTTLQNTTYVVMHHLPGMMVEFLLGSIAWKISKSGKNWRIFITLACLGVTGWFLLADMFARLGNEGINSTWMKNQTSWLAALTFSMVLPATTAVGTNAAPKTLIHASNWAGRLSYSSYLLHFAALQFVKQYLQPVEPVTVVFLASVMTLACSWLLYRYWENPWREFGRSIANYIYAKK